MGEDDGTVTAYRPPRGGKSGKSGEQGKRGAQPSLARSPSHSIFPRAAKAATVRNTDANRSAVPGAGLVHRRAAPITAKQPVRPTPSAGHDQGAAGRAEAAFKHEFDKWQLLIEAAQADKSLSPDQRAIAIAGLRFRQQIEANAARRRVLDEERQTAQAARRAARKLLNSPVTTA